MALEGRGTVAPTAVERDQAMRLRHTANDLFKLAMEGPPSELAILLDMKGNPAKGKEVFNACQDCHRKDGSGRANGASRYSRASITL